MEIQLNDYHKKVNAQKMASMAYWREHPSLQSAVKKRSTYETGGFAIPPQSINS